MARNWAIDADVAREHESACQTLALHVPDSQMAWTEHGAAFGRTLKNAHSAESPENIKRADARLKKISSTEGERNVGPDEATGGMKRTIELKVPAPGHHGRETDPRAD